MFRRFLTYCLLMLPVCTAMADGVDLWCTTDSMSLAYEGNRLVSVSDEGRHLLSADLFGFNDGADALVEYEYDENGNTVKDLNRKVSSIQYNSLNLRQRREDGLHLSKEQALCLRFAPSLLSKVTLTDGSAYSTQSPTTTKAGSTDKYGYYLKEIIITAKRRN